MGVLIHVTPFLATIVAPNFLPNWPVDFEASVLDVLGTTLGAALIGFELFGLVHNDFLSLVWTIRPYLYLMDSSY